MSFADIFLVSMLRRGYRM